jgi:hypothetical protein
MNLLLWVTLLTLMFEINSVVLTAYRLQVQKQIEQVKQNIYILGELIY